MMYANAAALCIALCTMAQVHAQAERGLVAHWNFNEGSGHVLHDRSGNNNHGKIHGATWVKVGGGYALKFDGVDDYVDCGSGRSLNITGPISLEAWAYLESPPQKTEAGIVGKFYESYALTYAANGRSYWYISSGGNSRRTPSLEPGSWHHVVGTFDGTTMSLYVNGTLVDVLTSKFKTVDKGKSFLMGCMVHDPATQDPGLRSTAHFDGMIDEVRVYGRSLSEVEIARNHNQHAEEKGRTLLDTSWFDRFNLTPPHFYFAENELDVSVDFWGLLPLPEGAEIVVTLGQPGADNPLQSRKIEAQPPKLRGDLRRTYVTATFLLSALTPGEYEIRAVLKDKTGSRFAETLAFQYPPASPEVPSPAAKTVGPLPKPFGTETYELDLCDGGGFKILLKGNAYPVESTFSYPHGGENTLLASSEEGSQCEPSWTVTTRRVGTKEYRVLARGQYYAIERKIELLPDRVAITDKIANLTDKDIGIIINNHLDTGKKDFPTCYLGGIEARGKQEAIHNPTAFVARKGLGLGLVATDDVYVAQGNLYSEEKGHTGILDDMFGLGPNASYTMTWSIYPVESDDYFDFINVVRNGLGLNGKTVDGPLTYMNRKLPVPERILHGLRPKYISLGCLAWSADDPDISIEGIEFIDFPKERARVRKVFAEIRKKYPGAYPMFHIAHSLYSTNKPERYADSRVIDKGGKQAVWPAGRSYLERYFSKENLDGGWNWYIFYPTLDNSFGKAMLEAVDVMMDEMGSAGVFADGLMLAYAGRFTYDRWDGHTVAIDPKTKTVQRKFGSVHLLSQEVILQYCKKIVEKGGVVLVDSGPGTLTFAREAPAAAYPVETGVKYSCRWTHLAPFPTALGWPAQAPKPSVYQDILKKLRLGVLWYDYYCRIGRSSIFSRMYPITIEEIHAGVVKGTQRLVTALSGTYGWPGDKDLHFADMSDGRGVLVPHHFLTTVDSSGARTQLTLGKDEMAVLKKVPVTIESERPVNVLVQQYDAQGVRLALNGHCDIQVAVRDGDFRVEPGATYVADTEAPKEAVADENGTVCFRIRLDGQLAFRIQVAQSR